MGKSKKMRNEKMSPQGSVAGVSVSKKGKFGGGSMARPAKKDTCRVNGLPGLYVKKPHSVG